VKGVRIEQLGCNESLALVGSDQRDICVRHFQSELDSVSKAVIYETEDAFRGSACSVGVAEFAYRISPLPVASSIPLQVLQQHGGIPKVIYFSTPSMLCWSSEYHSHFDKLKTLAPDWQFEHFGDEEMERVVRSECSDRERAAFLALNRKYGAARADFLRYHLMRSRGGLWLDAKSGFKNAIDWNLSRFYPLPPLVLGQWHRPLQHKRIPQDRHCLGEIQNWFLISAPNHPAWSAVLEGVVTNIEGYDYKRHGGGKPAVLQLTGPVAMSRILYPILSAWPHLRTRDVELGFHYDLLGRHEDKQSHFGGRVHYSKLAEPVVL